MTSADAIILESLAYAAALHEPLRDCRTPFWAATYVLRRRFAREGGPYRGSGAKKSERTLRELVREGVLTRRRASQKTIGVKLTPAGLDRAWRMVGTWP